MVFTVSRKSKKSNGTNKVQPPSGLQGLHQEKSTSGLQFHQEPECFDEEDPPGPPEIHLEDTGLSYVNTPGPPVIVTPTKCITEIDI